ncbi:lipopolysaccharide core heptose(II) kinase RfaY [Citrobacter amalonaticus]|uniref:Lipopolysaccharide core heptose(II) kinase RfaY n=1 Tax=Citrobacter amalonaticus TaxID=35703 RepID=A0A2S4RV93_CITAM|nr:lipopolysaccharide core heptose(II) kinase RfaY [Citrobacter amalonaticus]POT55638.1 lipopolysaccharide core heptose(II) kinase RfaY [Citrobacter amalonaticus]POT73850.1 lipopolysaccharide core heptose(II) kinase RfaY [Citrobacter amalonaticus]POU64075.1 lipopolysaccharide core heptose(II) kinase RfaY [Citrobacter amalonaticus]POV03707.1 lipopolysaccharide core heptose(II) kinase RfaY [Citrobacter amalonaticus]
MITSTRYRGFSFYYKNNENKYKEIFDQILSYQFKTIKVLRNIDDTKVSLIETKYGRFVFKVFAPKNKRNERFFKSFVKGDYYKNLIIETDRVRNSGLKFPNDFYFLAERKIFNYASVFIMLIEYVQGVELNDMPEISEEIKLEIKSSMEKLHSLNMLSGDPHRGNFIVSKNGVRIIDLSGKSCTAERKARDRMAMEKHLGIPNEIKDPGYYSVIYKTKFRKIIKKIKGKK